MCGYCGAALSKSAGSPAAAAPPPPPPRGQEQELWRGSYCGRAMAMQWIGYWLFVAAVVAGFVMLPPEVKENPLARGVAGALVALPFVWLLLKLAYRKLTLRYRLTNQRLIVLRGFLHRTQDEIELYRVDDVQIQQSIVGRVFNVGDVIVFAPTDKTEPKSCLAGIAAPDAVKEQIRECVRKFKDRALRMEQI